MHFWIDKRSQACGINGRQRIPASLSAGRRRWENKPIATVHRVQSSTLGITSSNEDRIRGTASVQAQGQQPYITPITSYPTQPTEVDSDIYIDTNLDPSSEAIRRNPAPVRKSKPRTTVAGIVACITIFTIMIFQFNHSDTSARVQTLIVTFITLMAVLASLLAFFCMLTCKHKCEPELTQNYHITEPTLAQDVELPVVQSSEEVLLVLHHATNSNASPLPRHLEPEPPPPYHLAVLLPPRVPEASPMPSAEEMPPPPYDKAVI